MHIGRFAGVEGFVSQTGQFKSYSEFNRKPIQLMQHKNTTKKYTKNIPCTAMMTATK